MMFQAHDGRLQMDEKTTDEFVVTAQVIGILRVESFNHLIDDAEEGRFIQPL